MTGGKNSKLHEPPLTYYPHTQYCVSVAGGHTLFEAAARVCLSDMPHREALSLRELEVCQWAAEGKQVSGIAQILGIPPRTVTFHLNRVVERLGANSKSQAISWALKQGLVRLNIDTALVENVDEGEQ